MSSSESLGENAQTLMYKNKQGDGGESGDGKCCWLAGSVIENMLYMKEKKPCIHICINTRDLLNNKLQRRCRIEMGISVNLWNWYVGVAVYS